MEPLNLEIDSDSNDAQGSIDDLIASLNSLQESVDNLSGSTEESTNASDGFGVSLGQIGNIIAGIGITDFIGNVINLGESFVMTSLQSAESLQNMGITMGYVFGTQGPQMLQFIDDLTLKSGLLSRDSLEQVSIQMSNLHLPTATFQQDLTDLANVAEGAGGSADRMNSILDTTGRVLAIAGQAGSVPALYFRRLELLIPGVTDALSKVTGLPATAFSTLSKNVKISVAEFEQVIQSLGEGKYAGALDAQGNTIAGFFGRIQSTFTDMIDSVLGEQTTGKTTGGSIFDLLNKSLKDFLGYIDANKGQIETWFKTEIKVFLDYVVAHKTDIENFFKNINKELTDFGSWITNNKQNIETMLNFITTLANGATAISNIFGKNTSLFGGNALLGVGATLASPSLDRIQSQVSNSKNTTINMHNNINSNTDINSMLEEMMYKLSSR